MTRQVPLPPPLEDVYRESEEWTDEVLKRPLSSGAAGLLLTLAYWIVPLAVLGVGIYAIVRYGLPPRSAGFMLLLIVAGVLTGIHQVLAPFLHRFRGAKDDRKPR